MHFGCAHNTCGLESMCSCPCWLLSFWRHPSMFSSMWLLSTCIAVPEGTPLYNAMLAPPTALPHALCVSLDASDLSSLSSLRPSTYARATCQRATPCFSSLAPTGWSCAPQHYRSPSSPAAAALRRAAAARGEQAALRPHHCRWVIQQ